MGLENNFYEAVLEWKAHCRKKAIHSFPEPFLNCDAYKRIVSMGPSILPFIHNEIKEEYDMDIKLEKELKIITKKVFGDDSVELFDENYKKICKDKSYQSYQKKYNKTIGNPGIFWGFAIKEIIPEFRLPIGKKGNKAPITNVAKGFIGLNVEEVQKATIEWLDKNMSKYTPKSDRLAI